MKLTAAIVHSYPNADVKFMDIDNIVKVAKMDGIVKDTVHLGIPCNLISLPIEHKFISAEYCQLILTPLDKISDEDAVEVCKFLYSNPALHNPIRGKIVATVGDWHSTRKGIEVIDYLRSKGYDCGHGSIPNLIAAGVAVEKEIL